MKNKLINIISFAPALMFHLWLKFDDWNFERKREKKIDQFFKRNPQLRRGNEI